MRQPRGAIAELRLGRVRHQVTLIGAPGPCQGPSGLPCGRPVGVRAGGHL